jgi:hypothetical protein
VEGFIMRMRLIPIPAFAPAHARRGEIGFYDGITLSMYRRVQERREEMLAVAHGVLEAYFDKMGLPDADSFPYLGALTGDYYWECNEVYRQHRCLGFADGDPAKERLWQVRVTLHACCLGRTEGHPEATDYCGVEVVLVFDPRSGCFECYSTGHQVI